MHEFQMTKQSWRKRSISDLSGGLPIFNPASGGGRRDNNNNQGWSSRSVMNYRLIHLIPVVVMLCFFILWCFSTPVELETKDGVTRFVPISDKKPQEENEATDVDLTVLALESQPDDFMSLSDGPDAPLDLGNESMENVSLLESPDVDLTTLALESPPDGFMSLSDGPDAPLDLGNVSIENVSLLESHDQNALLTEIHDSNALSSVSHEPKAPFSVSDELNASVSVHDEPSALSDSQEFNEFFSDSREPKASLSVSRVAKDFSPVSQESRISYPGTSNEAAPQLSGKG
ncbi:hypothetical protein CTI12_AA183420 [Artemisia annua]|uniref:Uncharacterized protein n=1 Tax=Artemisia annua TaxID=35608 RepID=A0A2U1P7V9_ARTAN|nr:hypothetical protein CTI12_AA183420 [Artemisia annua]